MSEQSNIEWTDATWNPVRGCTKVSPGCAHCYAETFAERWRGIPGHPYEQGFDLRLVPEKLTEPLRWKKPRRVFVNSMSDLFHKDVPDEFIDRVFAVMALARQHTFQVLTKRAERMAAYCDATYMPGGILVALDEMNRWDALSNTWPLPNVLLGVSVEDQQRADERIPHLLRTPAAVRFLSCEPLLGPVDLRKIAVEGTPDDAFIRPIHECREIDALSGMSYHPLGSGALGFGCPKVDWVIVGGESGQKARACHEEWERNIIDQCREAGVAVFRKQAGSNAFRHGQRVKYRNPKGGDPSEWPEDLRVRDFSNVAT